MKTLRIIFDLIVLASTTLVLAVIANFRFVGSMNDTLLTITLQTMHVSLLVAAALACIANPPKRSPIKFCAAMLPILALVFAFVLLVAFKFTFPSAILLGFDFYIIYAFFWLLLGEAKK